jgi:8-oxo-dGTP diphosphatase
MSNFIKVNIVAGVVLEKDGKFLLVQEKQPKCYGLWNLPAGKVEEGDSIEETAIKEAKEETGFDIELIEKIGIFQESTENAVKHSFQANIIGGELIYPDNSSFPKNELLDVRWFSLKEIETMKDKLRRAWVLESIRQAIKMR